MSRTRKLPEKFYGAKPLIIGMDTSSSFYLYDHPFREIVTYEGMPGQRMEEKEYNFIYGINALEEKMVKYDFLQQIDGHANLVHKRTLEKLQQICPNDFQAFPAIIKNIKKKNPDFENHDYYVLHILPIMDALDRNKSIIEVVHETRWEVKNIILKENCMEGHCLAHVKYNTSKIIFSPELVRELAYTIGLRFYSDREHFSWGGNALPYEAAPRIRPSKKSQ